VEVLLAQNIEHLGKIGDLVKVAPGYARNYLVPRGLARPVTAENLHRIELDRKLVQQEEAKRITTLKDLAGRIATTNVTLEVKASADGNLYGSVTNVMIAQELAKLGFDIHPSAVRLEHPLKQIGVFSVPIYLHQDVETNARVWVVQDKD
jgi:large subunit ribosomal protein L9